MTCGDVSRLALRERPAPGRPLRSGPLRRHLDQARGGRCPRRSVITEGVQRERPLAEEERRRVPVPGRRQLLGRRQLVDQPVRSGQRGNRIPALAAAGEDLRALGHQVSGQSRTDPADAAGRLGQRSGRREFPRRIARYAWKDKAVVNLSGSSASNASTAARSRWLRDSSQS